MYYQSPPPHTTEPPLSSDVTPAASGPAHHEWHFRAEIWQIELESPPPLVISRSLRAPIFSTRRPSLESVVFF